LKTLSSPPNLVSRPLAGEGALRPVVLLLCILLLHPHVSRTLNAQASPQVEDAPARQSAGAASVTPLDLVNAMVRNEAAARRRPVCFSYTSYERSTRTGRHLWEEKVVETPDGLMRRLVAEDGKPLPPDRAMAEDRRIAYLVASPEAFRAANADRHADEMRLAHVLDILPRAFLFTAAGEQDGVLRIAYRPNPSYVPVSFEERIVHQMGGTMLIEAQSMRLAGIDGHLLDRVSFGYGLLGHMEKGSGFSMRRAAVTAVDWKTTHVNVHMDGKILLLKSISREQESVHNDVHAMPANVSLAQVAALTRP
jgi:hypothetical protein